MKSNPTCSSRVKDELSNLSITVTILIRKVVKNMSLMRTNVLVVEDNKDVRARICAAIESDEELTVWGEAATVKQASQLLEFDLPEIALIDLGLPDGGGETIIAWLRKHAPNVETLVLTVFGDERHVISAIQSGASGYLLKGDTAESLSENIKLVLQGESPISPAVARHILNSTRKVPERESKNEKPDLRLEKPKLTPAEIEILNYIAKGFTGPEIAELTGRSVSTVPVHVRNIYKKLSVNGRGEAVFQAMQLGIIGSE